MSCMRCGKETDAEQVLCAACLADMEKYPVKPEAVVLLPTRSAPKVVPKKRPPISAETRIARLRRKNRILTLLVIGVAILAILFATTAIILLEQANIRRFWGKNYSTVSTTEPSSQTTP